jgi:hypothetical protein
MPAAVAGTNPENEMNNPQTRFTITAEADGTFIVRDMGRPLHRWPSFELAERRVYSLIRWAGYAAA